MNPSAVLRSERLRPLTRLAAWWGVWAALGLAFANPLLAQSGTPAGTVVTNEVTVSYSTQNGNTVQSVSTVSFTVGQVAGVDIDPPRIVVSEAGRDVVFPHLVSNVGNGPDRFHIVPSSTSGWPVQIYGDVDGDRFLTSPDTILTGPVALDLGGSVPVLMVVSVPVSAPPGSVEVFNLDVVSDFDGTMVDAVADEIRLLDAGLSTEVEKLVDLDQAAPGDLLTYSIRVRIDGAGQRDSVFLEDKIPDFATYEPGTLQLDGVNLTDAPDADPGSFSPATGVVRVDLGALPSGVDANLLLQARVDPLSPIGTVVENRARLVAHTPIGGLEDESAPAATQVAAPGLEITKSVVGFDPAAGGDSLVYVITVTNPSTELAATSLTVVDTLPTELNLGRTEPAAQVDGRVLSWTVDRLGPGETVRFEIHTEVAEVTDVTSVVNRAYLERDGASGEFADSEARTLLPSVEASLALGLEAEVVEIQLGEVLPLDATVTNDGPATVSELVVKLVLPDGTRFVDQGTLTGAFTADRLAPTLALEGGSGQQGGVDFIETPLQLDSFTVDGDTVRVWVPGELRPAESVQFRYVLLVDAAPDGMLLNEAIAEARRGALSATSTIEVASNQARAIVGLARNRALETRTVIGKVFLDLDGDGFQDPDEPGVGGVDVVTADGELVTTDGFGKLSFNEMRPGRHAFRVDPITVPDGMAVRTRGLGQRLQVVEVTGWNSPRVSFALDPVEGEVADDPRPTEEPRPPVRIDPLRSEEERDADARQAFLHGPTIRVVAPADGHVAPTNRLYIGVQAEPMAPVALFRGDSLLVSGQLLPNGAGDFVGVALEPGPQRFRVRTTNSWGTERWDSLVVHQTGPTTRLEPEDDRVVLVADGRTPTLTRVRLFDQWGVPVVNRPFVTVRVDGGTVSGEDVDPSSVGLQLQADPEGWVTIELLGGRTTGRGTLLVEAPDAEVEVPLALIAPVRPLLLTGVGQLSLGSGGDAFGAVTAQGRLTDETALTLSFDSRRLDQGRDVFGKSFDPLDEGQQPILGDASSQYSLSSSRYRFSAKVERGLDWLAFGDVQTSGFSDGMSLARYGRSLPGAAARLTTGSVVWDAFGASTTQALRQQQLRGAGSSGPFELGRGVLPGTEEVRVEVRALENPTRVLSEKLLTRYAEYQIDYERGVLLLKQPVPAADPFGNPVFLLVTYEGESGGSHSPVWGVRATSHLGDLLGTDADSVPISMSFVRDDQPGRGFQLGGFRTAWIRDGGLEITAELAVADGADSTGVATRFEGAAPLFDGRLQLGAEWSVVGDEFTNPANIALRPGSKEVRATAGADAWDGRLTATHERQSFSTRDLERSRTTVGYVQEVLEDVSVEARLAGDASESGAQEASSGAGEYKVTWSATPRLDLFAEGRSELWASGQGLANRGAYLGGGATLRLSERFGLEARHLRVDPTGDANPYGLTSVGLTSDLRVGTKAWGAYQLTGGIDGRRNAAIVGLNHRFAIGSDWRFSTMLERRRGVAGATLGDPVLVSPFEQPEDDYTSASIGTEYIPESKPYRASLRAESRNGDLSTTRLATLAGDVAVGSGLALLTRQELIERDMTGSLTTRYTRQRSSLWGLAYRPTTRDDLNILFKLGWKDAINPFGTGVLAAEGEESRLIGAVEAIWAPRPDVELGARFATRSTRLDTPLTEATSIVTRNETDFLGLRARWWANDWVGGELEARGLMSGLAPGAIWDVAPSIVAQPVEALEIELGYRFGDLQDPDFAVRSGRGLFLTLGTRVTEELVGSAAAFWRSRFGG